MSVEVAEQRQEREESFNNAVVLNNLACVLLRSGAFFDAFTTFRGAVDMLQSASVRRGETGLGKVAVALRKLRDTESLCGGSADVTVIGFEDEAIQHVVYEAAFGELMPYTITLRSPNQEEYGRDPDIDCAIILHNYALSHILLSQRGLLPDKQAHKGALYVFRVAFRIMFEKFGGLLDADGTVVNFGSVANYDISALVDNLCGAVTIVLSNLVYTLNRQGFERAARDAFLQLRDFLHSFAQSEASSFLGRPTTAAAA